MLLDLLERSVSLRRSRFRLLTWLTQLRSLSGSNNLISRKMGTYYMAVLLFKVYFKVRLPLPFFGREPSLTPASPLQLKSTALCKNLIKGIGAADLAPFSAYPIAHRVGLPWSRRQPRAKLTLPLQVSYLYYMGVFAFLREDYTEAEKQFCLALSLCHAKARRNIEFVLAFSLCQTSSSLTRSPLFRNPPGSSSTTSFLSFSSVASCPAKRPCASPSG